MRLIQRCFVLLISVLFCGMISLNAQTTWTGATSTAWNLAGNWSAGIPDADDDVTIPNVTNAPVISAAGALAKSVTVQSGATLTINAAGVLSINSAVTQGLTNAGIVQNNGTINLGNISGGFLSALKNNGTFNNNTGGKLNIDNIGGGQSEALGVSSGSTFNNAGTITIGGIANGQNGSGGLYGLRNAGTFNNKPGGVIKIDKVVSAGLNSNSSFTNEGDIILGSSPVPGNTSIRNGINNGLDFFNKSTGKIWIDNYIQYAIDASNFSTFDNEGQITIGKLNANTNLITGNQTGVVNNKTGAIFEATGNLPSTRYIGQGGTLSPGIAGGSATAGWLSFSNGINLSNTPLSIDVNGAGTPGVNYDQIGVNGIATLGSTLAVTFNSYTGATGDQIVILTSSGLSGKFSTVTGLPAGWTINYTATEVILSKGPLPGYNTWTGASNTSWTNAANWSKGTAPTTNDDALIPAGTTYSPTLSGTGGRARSVTVQTGATLTIAAPGILLINGSDRQGIFNQGTLTNNGTISIGNTSATGFHGIVNAGTFNNGSTGKLTIDRASLSAFYLQENNVNNEGLITVGAATYIQNLTLNGGAGLLNNNTGGVFKGAGDIYVNRFVNAGGTVSPGAPVGTISFSASRNFANTILDIELNGKTTAGTDFDNIGVGGVATLGGTLNVTVNYTPAAGDEITFLMATSVSGTFGTVHLPAGWAIQYLSYAVKLTYGQNYWTGAVSNSWHTAGNWSLGAVPVANQVVIIPDAANDPEISAGAATANTVAVLGGAVLTIDAGQSLSINGSPVQGLLNEGTVQNSGTLTIGNTATVGTNGIVNKGSFYNNSGSVINIDRIDVYQGNGILNQANKYFTNQGIIRIGATAGTSTSAGNTRGLRNDGIFSNTAGAKIYIDRAYTAVDNFAQNLNSFTNNGDIIIGGVTGGTAMGYGIYTLYNFANGTSGTINIDRVTTGIETGSQTSIEFINNGAISFGKSASVTNLINIGSLATFSNNASGVIEGSGNIVNGNFKNTGGTITPAWSSAALSFGKIVFNNNRDLSNSTLNMNVGGNATAGVDYDQLLVNGNLTIGGTLNLTVNYTPVAGDEITIISATAISGTFTTTNLPTGWTLSYAAGAVKIIFGDSPTTWTGAVNTDWTHAGNWSNGVPIAKSVVVIPDVTNDPHLNTVSPALGNLIIKTNGQLTVGSSGTLTVNGNGIQDILNEGTLINNGTITTGNAAPAVTQFMYNKGQFTNNVGGQLIVALLAGNAEAAIVNEDNFLNYGTVTIGSVGAVGKYGILNSGPFTNMTGAQVNIARASEAYINHSASSFVNNGNVFTGTVLNSNARYGLYNNSVFSNGGELRIQNVSNTSLHHMSQTFTNGGTIRIGADGGNGTDGIDNAGVFNNEVAGSIYIDLNINSGIYHHGTGFTNRGMIAVNSRNVSGYSTLWGIYIDEAFNNTTGQISINRSTSGIAVNANTFTNTGTVTIGDQVPMTTLIANRGTGTFSNGTNGVLKGTGSVEAVRFVNAGGKLYPGYTAAGKLSFTANENFSDANINIKVNGTATAGTNYDQVAVSGTAIISGGTLNVNINYIPAPGDRVKVLTATALQGTFNTVTGLPAKWKVIYTLTDVELEFDDTNYWTGNVSPAWNTTGNWSKGIVPGAGSTVVLPAAGPVRELTVTVGASVANFEIAAGRTVTINAGSSITATNNFINNGTIKGGGRIVNASFTNNGTIAPGLSPGTLSITGNLNNQGTIQAEIGGTTPGTLYDRLEVSGTVTLGGNLVITSINGFKPVAGQTYTIITGSSVTGSFASVTWPSGVTGTVTNTAGGVNLNIVSVLPLTLLEFNGQAVNDKVVLKWKTAEEVHTSHFSIERSTDGQHYAAFGNLTAAGSGAGNYSFTDANASNGNNYYRLKMIDIDGAYKYSPVVIVKFAKKGEVTISPVPATSYVIFTISDRSLAGQPAQVFSPAGNLVASLVLTVSNRIEIAHLPSGIYTIKTSSGSYRFIKQ